MAYIQDSRPGNSTIATVDPTFNALRMTLRPGEFQGAYRLATRSGTIAAATGAGIQFMFRYIGTGTCVIHSVKIGLQTTAAYTQGAISFTLNVVRGWSISDTSGTQITLGNIQKLRSAMTQAQVDIRVQTTSTLTAAATTAAIEDPAPFSSVQFNMPAAVTPQPMAEMLPMSWYSKPLTLTLNEGFRVRNQSNYAGTGTSVLAVYVAWTEYPAVSTYFY